MRCVLYETGYDFLSHDRSPQGVRIVHLFIRSFIHSLIHSPGTPGTLLFTKYSEKHWESREGGIVTAFKGHTILCMHSSCPTLILLSCVASQTECSTGLLSRASVPLMDSSDTGLFLGAKWDPVALRFVCVFELPGPLTEVVFTPFSRPSGSPSEVYIL